MHICYRHTHIYIHTHNRMHIIYVADAINADVAMPVGEKFLLRCQRNPGVKIEWYKDDEALRSTTRIRVTKQSVKFKYVDVDDTGVYGCRLESNETVEWRNVTVRIETLQNDGFQNEAEETSDVMSILRPEEESNDLEIETRSKFILLRKSISYY